MTTINDLHRAIRKERSEEVVREYWYEYQKTLQRPAWVETQRADYEDFLSTLVTTKEVDNGDGETVTVNLTTHEIEGYLNIEQWLSLCEQIEVPEATKVIDEVTNEDGEVVVEAQTIVTPAYFVDGDLLRPHIEDSSTFALFEDNEDCIEFLRQAKLRAFDKATVTISTSKVFDANERSNTRMTLAITAVQTLLDLGKLEVAETAWILADNTTQAITLDELKEAQALSTLELAKAVL